MKMSSSLSKILEIGINVFKSNFQIIKIKYYEISTIYECVEKLSMIIGCFFLLKKNEYILEIRFYPA